MAGDQDFGKQKINESVMFQVKSCVVYRDGQLRTDIADPFLVRIGDIVIEPGSGRNIKITSVAGGDRDVILMGDVVVDHEEKYKGKDSSRGM